MASRLVDCLIQLKGRGGLDSEAEAELSRVVTGFEEAMARTGNGDISTAEIRAVQAKLAEAELLKRQAELQIARTRTNLEAAEADPKGFQRGVRTILDGLDRRQGSVEASLQQEFAEGLSLMHTRMFGLTQDNVLVRDVMRELHGTDTGNSIAKRVAAEWSTMAEKARLRFNAAGGDIRFRRDWGSPQNHEWRAIRGAGREGWKDFVRPLLDNERMTDTDGVPLGPQELEASLDEIFETLSTNGMNKLRDLEVARPGKLANRHRDPRFLIYKNGDAWDKYQAQFGPPDAFASLNGHIRRMSQEISQLEILGPNPAHAFDVLEQGARIHMGEGPLEALKVEFLKNYWRVVSGEADQRTEGLLYHIGRVTKNTLVASKLGMATISAVSDTAFTKVTANFNGMPVMRVFRRQISLMNPKNEADRVFFVRLGIGAEGMTGRNTAISRFADIEGTRISDRITETTMRMSGLNNWTDNLRRAFGGEFLGFLGERVDLGFDELPAKLRTNMGAYGIDAADWDLVRTGELADLGGAKFLRPESIVESAADPAAALRVSTKFQELVQTEMDFASPLPNARVRAYLTQGTSKGTWAGEAASAFALFKSFPVTVIATHAARALSLDKPASRAIYGARVVLFSTIMGSLAVQAKQMLRGKDPLDMDDPGFWMRAFAQGGGAGIIGDIIVQDTNRFGHGVVETFLGPVAGLLDDAWALTIGNVQQAVRGEEVDLADEMVRFASMYTPGSSLWYTRIALERLVFDELNKAVNPNAARDNARRARSLKKRTGQDYWWRQGTTSPQRLPQ